MKSGKIMTLHPEGKKGVNISRERYEKIKEPILDILEKKGRISRTDLLEEVRKVVEKDFDGSVTWYFTTVKLDLQARDDIRVEKVKGIQYVSRD